jgi:hypothetical protein
MTTSVPAFANLEGHTYMNLTTFRKSGAAVPTPVWFAQADNRLYVVTDMRTGKVKRLRNSPRVEVAPCTARGELLGPAAAGSGRILGEEESTVARVLLDRKYGMLRAMHHITLMLTGRVRSTVYLEIVPA